MGISPKTRALIISESISVEASCAPHANMLNRRANHVEVQFNGGFVKASGLDFALS